jgi:hypothetical protein
MIFKIPNSDLNEFLRHLELTVSGAGNKKAILTGDININMLNQHESYAYRKVFHNYGFIVTNEKLTREESGKILDHLAINFNKIQLNNITFDTCIPTDHMGILGSFGNNATSRIPSTTTVGKIDYERMPDCFLGLISGYYRFRTQMI